MTPLSVVLSIGLTVFWGISLQNVLQNRKTTAGDRSETPMSQGFILALFGSLFMFAETLAFIALDFTGKIVAELEVVQGLGLALFFIGSALHAWSVQVRGRYAVSWPMPEDQKLIIDPPYSFVRHPSYLAYMLMIIGVTLIWQRWFTLIPWIAIPGYYLVSKQEEEYLIERFGDQYKEYMKRVGAFIPRPLGHRETPIDS